MSSSPSSPGPAADLPDGDQLLALERQARRDGSGLTPDQLLGSWRLEQVWSRRGCRPLAIPAALLRGLGAALAVQPGAGGVGLELVNRVGIGGVELRFQGEGALAGRRPLLGFGFERCQLRLGDRTLVERRLPAPDPRRQPFFALIGRGVTGAGRQWLAARGRGGGLALWCLED